MAAAAAAAAATILTDSPAAPSTAAAKTIEEGADGGDFLLPVLRPGEIQPIQWRDTQQAVSKNAYTIGLEPTLRESLLEYCNCMGITQILKDKLRHNDLTLSANGDDRPCVEPIRLQGKEWQLQCSPSLSIWKSNMHWISPLDDVAYQAFLRAFSVAGFDQVLVSIGKHFGFEGLVAYHPSILAVSHCDHGTIHLDCTNTGAKVMNVIIPLLLASDAGPELRLQDDRPNHQTGRYKVGNLQYQYDVAALVGDEVYHSTSAVNYGALARSNSNTSNTRNSNTSNTMSPNNEIRMAATIFVADLSETNILAAMDQFVTYPGHYPPPSQPELLLKTAGAHWQQSDPSKKLPSSVLPTTMM